MLARCCDLCTMLEGTLTPKSPSPLSFFHKKLLGIVQLLPEARREAFSELPQQQIEQAVEAYFGQTVWDPHTSKLVANHQFILPKTDPFLTGNDQSDLSYVLGEITHLKDKSSVTDLRANHVRYGADFLKSLGPDEQLPFSLIPQMIKGAEMSNVDTADREKMIRFLRTRGWYRPMSAPFATLPFHQLLASVNTIKIKEGMTNAMPPLIRSPEGWSLRAFYEAANLPFDFRGRKVRDISIERFDPFGSGKIATIIQSKIDQNKWVEVTHRHTLNVKHDSFPQISSRLVNDYLIDEKLPSSKGWRMMHEYSSVLTSLKWTEPDHEVSKYQVHGRTSKDDR